MKRTIILKVNPDYPDKKLISRAAKKLRLGGLIAFPTETVYGLGVNTLNKSAIRRLKKIKNRPKGKPFTVHIHNAAIIKKFGCAITRPARRLIKKYWPGPLTIILAGAGGVKVGFRMPANKVALTLIGESGVPVSAPSANLSGQNPPTTAEDVLRQLDGKVDILIDAGPTEIGVESTVIDMTVTPPKVLREGAIKEKELLGAFYG